MQNTDRVTMTGKSFHFDEEAALEAAANNNQGNGVGALELKKLININVSYLFFSTFLLFMLKGNNGFFFVVFF